MSAAEALLRLCERAELLADQVDALPSLSMRSFLANQVIREKVRLLVIRAKVSDLVSAKAVTGTIEQIASERQGPKSPWLPWCLKVYRTIETLQIPVEPPKVAPPAPTKPALPPKPEKVPVVKPKPKPRAQPVVTLTPRKKPRQKPKQSQPGQPWLYTRTCRRCGTVFKTEDAHKKACSAPCSKPKSYPRKPAKRRVYKPKPPQQVSCRICAKSFTRTHRATVYCSVKCRNKRQINLRKAERAELLQQPLQAGEKRRTTVECLHCKKSFVQNTTKHVLCTPKCRKVWLRERYFAAQNRTPGGPMQKVCAHCLQTFRTTIAYDTYCSLRCRTLAKKKRAEQSMLTNGRLCNVCKEHYIPDPWWNKTCSKRECASELLERRREARRAASSRTRQGASGTAAVAVSRAPSEDDPS